MFCIRSVAGPLLACLLSLAVPVDDRPGKAIAGWGEIIDPDGDCQITAVKGKVTIQVPGKAHDFAGELQRWNAPRVLSPVKGDFIVEVKVGGELKPSDTSTIPGRRSYNGAGLMIIKDKDNHVSLHHGAVHLDNGVRHYANFELRKDAELVVSRFELDLEDKEVYLRIRRQGDKFSAQASHDGVTWKSYDEPITVEFPEEVQVGVEAVNSSDRPFRCVLEGFKVSRAAKE